MQEVKGVGPWFAYILPSALVIGFLSPAAFAIIDALLASHVGCMCDSFWKTLTDSNTVFSFSEC
jgi:predicted outer membrane lipoprotein